MNKPPLSLKCIEKYIPNPALLFFLAACVTVILSWLLSALEISAVIQEKEIHVVSLLSADGLYWIVVNLVKNFVEFAPLGVVVVTMLGIGVAEKTGALSELIGFFAARTPVLLLSPFIIFVGIFSSVGLDAGYIVLPPIAAQICIAAGKPAALGIAAAFAGVSAGFGANILLTGIDPILASFSTEAIRIVDSEAAVSPTANWYFMIASTFFLTLVGWFVSEKLLNFENLEAQPVPQIERLPLSMPMKMSLALSSIWLVAFIFLAITPGSFLFGQEGPFPKWVNALVPFLFSFFLVFGVSYGIATKKIQDSNTVFLHMVEVIKDLAPIIVLCFFAAQFVAFFDHSQIGKVLAFASATQLAAWQLSPLLLLSAFILITMIFNVFIGSMSAKYALLAPLFIPVFALLGIGPEVTQLAYRIGDSVTNIITPLNPYFIVVLGVLQIYQPKAGVLTLLRLMLPYAICFAVSWGLFFLGWIYLEIPLGPK